MPIHDRLTALEEDVVGGDDSEREIAVEWREADPEARPKGMEWDAAENTLRYDFWDAQGAALLALEEDANDIVAFLAGYRSGKSIAGARWLISQALRHPGERFLALGVDYSRAVSTTYQVLFEQLPGERTSIVTSNFRGPEQSPIVADYHRGEHRLTLVNDSQILLGSADSWSRYAGAEFAGVWADEAALYDDLHRILEVIGSRLTADSGPKCQFWTTTGQGYNSAWEVLEQRQDEDGDPLALEIEVIRASVTENPYLSDEDLERLKRQFAQTGKEGQALHGEFVQASGLVYSDFDRETHVVDHGELLERVRGQRRLYGYDAGWRDPRVVLEAARTYYDQLAIVDCFYESGVHVEDAIEWLETNGKPRKGTVYCEHEPSDIEKIERAGWHAEKAEKSIDAGIAEVRSLLEADESGRPGLVISDRPSCEPLIQEFLGYKVEHVGTGQATDHGLDALRYLAMGDTGQPGLGIVGGDPTYL